jgi:HAE1 family hydrophobic/amphiphilic exporter-1
MKYFYDRHLSAYMLFGALMILGIVGYKKIPMSLMPNVAYPGISIIIEYPGTSPEKVESIITKPVEKAIKTLQGIEKIDSVSEEGQARINVSFKVNTDIKLAALQAREKIGIIRSDFPKDVQEPTVVRFDPSDKPAVIATIDIPDRTQYEIREFADRKIKPGLQRIDGVSEIVIVGGAQKEIHVDINNARYESRQMSYNELYEAIQNNNISLPGGRIMSGGREMHVSVSQKFVSVDELADTVVYSSPGSMMRFRDFAEVQTGWKEREDYSRYNGVEKVTIYVHQAGDANSIDVCGGIKRVFNGVKEGTVKIIYNQAEYITSSLFNVVVSCIWGAVLIFIILYVFFRRTEIVFVILVSIPVSLMCSFLLMYYTGIELNMMSMSGLSLGASIVIDNGIVIVSAIYETRRKITAEHVYARVGMIKGAIIASTVSTLVVFFPILFSDEQTRQVYSGLAYTISIVLLMSLLVILVLLPVMLVDLQGKKPVSSLLARLRGGEQTIVAERYIKKVDEALDRLNPLRDRAYRTYRKVLEYAMDNPRRIMVALCALIIISVVALNFIRKELVDPMSTGEFYVYVEFPTGTTIDRTDAAMKLAEGALAKMDVTEKVTTKVEKWRGTLSIKLKKEFDSLKKSEAAKADIKKNLTAVVARDEGFVFITEADEVNARELTITILGDDNELLKKYARECAHKVSAISGIEDTVLRFREGRPEFVFTIDKGKADISGLYAADIGNYMRTSLYGPVISKFIDNGREIDIRMRMDPLLVNTIDDVKRIGIPNKKGKYVQLRDLADVREATGDTKIWRKNGKRCVSITAKLGRLSFEGAVTEIDKALSNIRWQEDYGYEYDEIVKNMKKTRNSMVISLIFAITLVYMILASKFESFSVPAVIILSVPLSFIGVINALFLFGGSLNIAVYIGLIVLIGIAVNNGIVLVHAVNEEYLSGAMNARNIREIITRAGMSRVKPVSITAITTTLAMIPALIRGGNGSNLWRPLAFTVISGLICAYFATLIVMPVFSAFIYRIKIRMRAMRAARGDAYNGKKRKKPGSAGFREMEV